MNLVPLRMSVTPAKAGAGDLVIVTTQYVNTESEIEQDQNRASDSKVQTIALFLIGVNPRRNRPGAWG